MIVVLPPHSSDLPRSLSKQISLTSFPVVWHYNNPSSHSVWHQQKTLPPVVSSMLSLTDRTKILRHRFVSLPAVKRQVKWDVTWTELEMATDSTLKNRIISHINEQISHTCLKNNCETINYLPQTVQDVKVLPSTDMAVKVCSKSFHMFSRFTSIPHPFPSRSLHGRQSHPNLHSVPEKLHNYIKCHIPVFFPPNYSPYTQPTSQSKKLNFLHSDVVACEKYQMLRSWRDLKGDSWPNFSFISCKVS